MTHRELDHVLAAIVLVCASAILVVDIAEELNADIARNFKWSLGWSILRYLGIVCALLLALDVLF
jgi:hypothetical protein